MNATVVLSCYNQYKYIKECIDSILNQEVDFDFDILIADDCSTDGTTAIVNDYQSLNPEQIHVLTRKNNLGPAKNYIDAHKAATGDIVFHIDGDDIMLPGKLQKQYDLFKKNDEINLVFHRALYFSDDGSYNAQSGTPISSCNGFMYFDAHDLALWGSITVHSAYAYRRSSRSFCWPESDFMEWYFAMDSLLPEGKGAYIDEILVKYRCNPTGAAYLATKAGRTRAYNIYLNDLVHYFKKFPTLKAELYSNYLITVIAMLRNGSSLSKTASVFMLRHCYLFNPFKLKNTLAMRLSVAPEKRIRRETHAK